MLKKRSLTLKILIFLIFVDFLETFSQFCFKKTALPESGFEIRALADAFIFAKAAVLSPYLWLGLFSVMLTFILWSTILSRIDLSVAVPICSFSYVTIPLVSILFFHERITYFRWSGILLILTGVILVSLSSKQREGQI